MPGAAKKSITAMPIMLAHLPKCADITLSLCGKKAHPSVVAWPCAETGIKFGFASIRPQEIGWVKNLIDAWSLRIPVDKKIKG